MAADNGKGPKCSLSVEIQFYLVVPFLVMFLNYFRLATRLLFTLLIGACSFWLQFTSLNNQEHMSFNGRIWQFMCGFIAFYLHELHVFDKKSDQKSEVFMFVNFVLNVEV